MVKPLTVICFIVVVAAQWLITGQMIWKHEGMIKKGQVLRFESAPYDPEDPFRGRYISLNFKNSFYRKPKSSSLKDQRISDSAQALHQKVFVTFTNDSRGYAEISGISFNRPSSGAYLLMEPPSINESRGDSVSYNFRFPFREFYMEESKAPEAESIYADRLRDSATRSYTAIRLWEGEGVIENVFINDSTIQQIVMAARAKKK